MTNFQKLNEIESVLRSEAPEIYQSEEWSVLRFYCFFSFGQFKKQEPKVAKTQILSQGLRSLFSLIGFIFQSPKNKTWVLSENNEVREVDGKRINKIFHPLLDGSGENILLERMTNAKRKPSQYSNKVEIFFVEVFLKLIARFWPRSSSTKVQEIRERLLKNGIESTGRFENKWREYQLSKAFWSKFMTWFPPRRLLATNYHNAFNMGFIWAAKHKKIPVFEFQHGVIAPTHPAYYYDASVAKDMRPEYLVYNMLPELPRQGMVYEPGRCFHLESYILFQVKKDRQKNFVELTRGSGVKTVIISLQNSSYQKVYDFVIEAISKLQRQDLQFVFLPRDHVPKNQPTQSRVQIEKQKNFYELLAMADLHITYHSTTALEAAAVGVPNVCVDISGLASEYFNSFFKSSPEFYYANDSDDLALYLQNWQPSEPSLEDSSELSVSYFQQRFNEISANEIL